MRSMQLYKLFYADLKNGNFLNWYIFWSFWKMTNELSDNKFPGGWEKSFREM